MRALLSLYCVVLMSLYSPVSTAAENDPKDVNAGTLVYVGTYTGGEGKGIYLFQFAAAGAGEDGPRLLPLGLVAELPNASFIDIDEDRRLLFAVSELDHANGRRGGAVSAYTIDDQGQLTPINQQSTHGEGPCHLELDKTGRFVLAANYGGGNLAVIPVAEDGRLGEATAVVQHEGSSVNQQRQEGPHAHFVATDPSNKFALACDLGVDRVFVYRFDAEHGKLTPNDPPAAKLKPGAGPRHLAFHPDGKHAYVINELDSTITAFNFDAETGALSELQAVSTLPSAFTGENTTAEIAVHPDGKFLYASNRGHDSLAIFKIDASTGRIESVGTQPTGGKTPRHFELDPEGRWVIAGNQNSNTLVVFKIDRSTGQLIPTGEAIDCPAPACVKFLPAAAP